MWRGCNTDYLLFIIIIVVVFVLLLNNTYNLYKIRLFNIITE